MIADVMALALPQGEDLSHEAHCHRLRCIISGWNRHKIKVKSTRSEALSNSTAG